MGGHYGSVQLHTADRQRVKEAAELVARAKGIKCLVGPALNGWVGVYPQNNGQDEKVGQEIARRVGGEAIHLLVHDDDIFAYWFWRDGRLIDSYWSKPGYFGDDNLEAEQAMAGTPKEFAHLVGDRLEDLRKLLDRSGDYVFEYERLMQFGELLGIRNAVSAYEYLKDGETDDIEGWEEFEEIPLEILKREKRARNQRKRKEDAWRQQMRDDGLLLYEKHDKEEMPRACAVEGGFLVGWSLHGFRETEARLEKYSPPWTGPIDPTIPIGGQLNAMSSDRSGKRVALALGKRIVVLGGESWQTVLEIPEHDWTIDVAMSADGKLVAHSSREETVVIEVDTARRVTSWSSESDSLCFHPSGSWLTRGGSNLGIAPVEKDSFWRQLSFGHLRAFGLAFSADGNRLLCGTSTDLRTYQWASIVSAWRGPMPEPAHCYETSQVNSIGLPTGYIYAVAELPDASGVLFAGLSGTISHLDYPSGSVRELVKTPLSIFHISLSSETDAIGILGRKKIDESKGNEPDSLHWQIWRTSQLMKLL